MSDQLAASSRVRVPRRVPGTMYPATNPTPQAEGGASLLVSRTVVRRGLLLSVAFLLVGSTVVKSINIGWGNDRIFGLLQLLWLDREANLPAGSHRPSSSSLRSSLPLSRLRPVTKGGCTWAGA